MNKLTDTIKKLITIRGENKLDVSDECLFDNAVKIFISNNITESKTQPKETPINYKKQLEKPTDKQINFFKRNNITIPAGMTKLEATKIISEYKNEN